MTYVESERTKFWSVLQNYLDTHGRPFNIDVQYRNGQPKQSAHILNGEGLLHIVFSVEKAVLRICVYITDNEFLYNRLKMRQQEIEQKLGYEIKFTAGEKNPNVKWVKKEWKITEFDLGGYRKLIEDTFDDMVAFVRVMKDYI